MWYSLQQHLVGVPMTLRNALIGQPAGIHRISSHSLIE